MKVNYKISQRRVKNPRIEVCPGEVRIIVPAEVHPKKIIEKYRRWIEKKLREMEKLEKKIPGSETFRKKQGRVL